MKEKNKKITFLGGLTVLVFALLFQVVHKVDALSVNLVPNPSLENASSNPAIPQAWQKGGTGANTRILTYPVAGYDGAKAAKTEITTYSDGDAKWYFQQVPVSGGETYEFKDMYTSTTTSYVTLRYTLSDGSYKYPDLERNISAQSAWTPFQKTFTIPTNYNLPVSYVTVFHLIKSVGTLTVDAYSLTKIDTTPPIVFVSVPLAQPVSGTVVLTANASDENGIASVQFLVDGVAIGVPLVGEPYTVPLDTTTLTNGTHSISARALDTSNNLGQSVVATLQVQNTIVPTTGTIIFKTHVVNNDVGTATANTFTGHLTSSAVEIAGSPFSGTEEGVSFIVTPGEYVFSQDTVIGYQTGIFSGDCNASGALVIAAGEIKNCLITNDDTPLPTGTITVTNVIVNDNGATKTILDFPLFINNDNVTSGVSTTVSVGNYIVSEITDPNYTRTISGDCDQNGLVVVNAGDHKFCTITNDDIAAVPPITTPNLIANYSFETTGTNGLPQSWQKGGSGANTRTLSYPVAGYDGVKAAKTQISSYTSGDAKWYFAYVPAQSGQQFLFSDFYTATTPSYVTMQYQLQDGTFKYQDILTNLPAQGTWMQATQSFVVPTYSQPVIAMTAFHLIKSVGVLTVDNYSLQQIMPPSPTDPTNLIINPSVETISVANNSLPYGWNKSVSSGTTATFSYGTPSQDGTKSVTVNASSYTSGAGAKWYFQEVNVLPGEEYRFTDFYTSTTQSFVTVQFRLADGTYQYTDLMRLTPSATWKQAQDTFVVPANALALTVLHGIKSVGSLTTDTYSLRKLTNGTFAHGMVSLNFDDGLSSVYQNAIPILDAHNLKSSQYIITHNFTDQPNYITVAQMLAMNAAGHEIGSHTQTHPYLTQITTLQAQNEIVNSKGELAALGVTPNNVFVYPYGDYNDVIRQMVIDAGYVGARSVHTGYNTKNSDKFALRDQHVESNTTFEQIRGYIDTAMATNTWLILEFHDTNNLGDQYSNTPELMTQVANYLVAQSVPVVTTAEGIALMN